MHKRVMALLLSLVLLVSAIMPTTAMAAEDEGGSFVFVATQVRPIFPVLAGISGSYNTMFMLWSLLSYKKNVLRLVIRVNKKECAKAHSRAERGRLRRPSSSRECAS